MAFTESFYGYIETTTDTLLVFEACRRGILPKINRRLQEKERNAIRSGTVFVFDERESGIKQWTNGLIWSPSRILGNFLIYRELDGRANNSNQLKRASTSSCDNSFSLYQQQQSYQESDLRYDPSSVFSSPTTPPPPQQVSPRSSFDQESHYRERALLGSLTTSYKFKPNGLIKKTMSIVLNGSHLHMISYYNKDDVLNNKLPTPSTTPQLANLNISPDMIQRQSFRVSPLLESRLSHLYMNDTSPSSPSSSSSPSPFMNSTNPNTTTTTNMNGRDSYYFQQQQQQHYHHHHQQMKSLPSPSTSPCSTNSLNTMLNNHHPTSFMKTDPYSTPITTTTSTKIGQKRKERSISPSSSLDLMDNDHNRKYSKTHMDDTGSLRSSFSSQHEKMHANHNSNNNNIISSEYMVYGNNNNNTSSSSPPPHSTTVSPITSNYALPSTHHHHHHHHHHQQQQHDQNKIKVSYLNMNHTSNDQYQHPLDNSLPSPRSNPDNSNHTNYYSQNNTHITPTEHDNHNNHNNSLLDNSMLYFNSNTNSNNNNNNVTRSQQQHPLYTRDTTTYPQSPSTPTTIHSSNYSAFSPPSSQQQPPPPSSSNSSSPGDHYNRHVYHPSVRHSIVHPSSSFLPSPF
ncbi:unnamed protein product [Cunninghamella echinulata]